jgi:hypothetical protein
MADTARDRAEAELRLDAARSNRLIAESADCDHHVVARVRARLEATAQIPPVAVRTPRAPNGPRSLGRAQQAVADLGPGCTTREVMELAGVGRGAAWRARTHPRHQPRLADAAAATDQLSVVRTRAPRWENPPKTPRTGRYRVSDTATPSGYYRPSDAIELACAFCTLVYRDSRWQHDMACILAAR